MLQVESETPVLALRPDVVVTVLEDEAVLLDLETKYFYTVNATGWAIVQLFEQGTTRAGIFERCHGWGAGSDAAESIARFVDVIAAERLAVPSSAVESSAAVTAPRAWVPPIIEKHKEPLQRVMVSAFDPSMPLAE